MNQSLINELRAHAIKVQVAMRRIEEERETNDNPTWLSEQYAVLLGAKANCLNGIAVLVAANKR